MRNGIAEDVITGLSSADRDDVWAGWRAVCFELGRSGRPIGQILRFNVH